MAGREFQGAGGLRLHLDEPYSPQMEEQIAKGRLVPVAEDSATELEGQAPQPHAGPQGGDTEPAGEGPQRPAANAKVDDWRAYAVSLGMDEGEAADATKKELQDWTEVAEGDSGSGAGE